jgi:hypothetical protein
MKHLELSYFPVRTTAMLVLIMGMTMMNDISTELLKAINFDPLIYAIVAIGVGLIIVVWFMHEIKLSNMP